LDEPSVVRTGLAGIDAVLNAAGPFEDTFRPMVRACLDVGCHYVDVTGELSVLEEIMSLGGQAREAGIGLLPGMGFDVVPTDCLAAAVSSQLPGATHLDIAFLASGRPSGGSLKGILDGLARPGAVRSGGNIIAVQQGSIRRTVDFSDGARELVAIPWGDVSTAWHSTGVPNVRVFTEVTGVQLALLQFVRPVVASRRVRRGLKALLSRAGGPGQGELTRGWARIWCEARDAAGHRKTAELTIPNGYTFTADSALAGIVRVAGGPSALNQTGALTPSMAFGSDFVDGLEGVEWVTRP
jgi:saccharopine dehydrogenase (NAD+, L-lysine-forming)